MRAYLCKGEKYFRMTKHLRLGDSKHSCAIPRKQSVICLLFALSLLVQGMYFVCEPALNYMSACKVY